MFSNFRQQIYSVLIFSGLLGEIKAAQDFQIGPTECNFTQWAEEKKISFKNKDSFNLPLEEQDLKKFSKWQKELDFDHTVATTDKKCHDFLSILFQVAQNRLKNFISLRDFSKLFEIKIESFPEDPIENFEAFYFFEDLTNLELKNVQKIASYEPFIKSTQSLAYLILANSIFDFKKIAARPNDFWVEFRGLKEILLEDPGLRISELVFGSSSSEIEKIKVVRNGPANFSNLNPNDEQNFQEAKSQSERTMGPQDLVLNFQGGCSKKLVLDIQTNQSFSFLGKLTDCPLQKYEDASFSSPNIISKYNIDSSLSQNHKIRKNCPSGNSFVCEMSYLFSWRGSLDSLRIDPKKKPPNPKEYLVNDFLRNSIIWFADDYLDSNRFTNPLFPLVYLAHTVENAPIQILNMSEDAPSDLNNLGPLFSFPELPNLDQDSKPNPGRIATAHAKLEYHSFEQNLFEQFFNLFRINSDLKKIFFYHSLSGQENLAQNWLYFVPYIPYRDQKVRAKLFKNGKPNLEFFNGHEPFSHILRTITLNGIDLELYVWQVDRLTQLGSRLLCRLWNEAPYTIWLKNPSSKKYYLEEKVGKTSIHKNVIPQEGKIPELIWRQMKNYEKATFDVAQPKRLRNFLKQNPDAYTVLKNIFPELADLMNDELYARYLKNNCQNFERFSADEASSASNKKK